MALLRWTIRIHKWLALLVGIQIILWIAGGVVMSVLPLREVRGEHNMAEPAETVFNLGTIMTINFS